VQNQSTKMEANINNNRDQIVDVGSVVEAVSADAGDAPLYTLESLCMRCHQNVSFHLFSMCLFISFFAYAIVPLFNFSFCFFLFTSFYSSTHHLFFFLSHFSSSFPLFTFS
jgi:hypothetical protein